jgi:dTMP kinase
VVTPRFIVFEGIDGSGTSTQANLLHGALVSAGYRAAKTSEPSDGPVGHLIREINTGRVHVSGDHVTVDRHMAYLFAADRYDHLHNDVDGILHRLACGFSVISTRYYLSSYAYNTHTVADLELVRTLNAAFPMPDITFYFEIDPELACSRIEAAGRPRDRNETMQNLLRVQANYRRALEGYAGRVEYIQAAAPPSSIHAQIMQTILPMVSQ